MLRLHLRNRSRLRCVCDPVHLWPREQQPDGAAGDDRRLQACFRRPDHRRDHAAQIQGFFDIPVDNLLGSPLFVDYFKSRFGDDENTMVVSPDVGSVARARAFAQKLGMTMAIVDKRRQKANSSEVMSIIGDVKGKRVILLDDMVDTAGSLCGAAKALVEIGGATEVYACASHGVLSGPAIQRIEDSVIKEVLFLDTIPAKEGVKCDKIKYLSAAPMLADAISFIYHEDSVSRLFV